MVTMKVILDFTQPVFIYKIIAKHKTQEISMRLNYLQME
jgi:hypothetical protein